MQSNQYLIIYKCGSILATKAVIKHEARSLKKKKISEDQQAQHWDTSYFPLFKTRQEVRRPC